MIHKNQALQMLTSMQTPAYCHYFASITRPQDLEECRQHPAWHSHPAMILGGGTNLLFTKTFPGIVLQPQMRGMHITKQNSNQSLVTFQAAENWDDCVKFCLQNQLYGLENLSGIPGQVGAAAVQNIGAYGVEIKDFFAYLDAYNLDNGQTIRFTLEECEFAYRNSIFKQSQHNQYLIYSVTLRCNHTAQPNTQYHHLRTALEKNNKPKPTAMELRTAVLQLRNSKLPNPSLIPNAGSFFKNPIVHNSKLTQLQKTYPEIPFYYISDTLSKIPAAWLIEQCDYKNKCCEGIKVYKKQALVLTNTQQASGEKVWGFAEKIVSDVQKKFDIQLQPEVKII